MIRFRSFTAAVALALAALAAPAVHAGGIDTMNCVVSGSFFSCVQQRDRPFPERIAPLDPREQAEADERERKWLARCRPEIRQDRYGVGRYHYAAAGCEFGRSQD